MVKEHNCIRRHNKKNQRKKTIMSSFIERKKINKMLVTLGKINIGSFCIVTLKSNIALEEEEKSNLLNKYKFINNCRNNKQEDVRATEKQFY